MLVLGVSRLFLNQLSVCKNKIANGYSRNFVCQLDILETLFHY